MWIKIADAMNIFCLSVELIAAIAQFDIKGKGEYNESR